MTRIITPETQALLDRLRDFQLVEISFKPTEWSIHLTFTFGPNVKDIVVNLFEIAHFILSKNPDDNDGCYMVGEVTLTSITDGGLRVLSSLNYPFKNRDGSIFSYPSKQLFYWHLEGDVCLEVICGKYELFQIENKTEI
jgi:hypothetical protein